MLDAAGRPPMIDFAAERQRTRDAARRRAMRDMRASVILGQIEKLARKAAILFDEARNDRDA